MKSFKLILNHLNFFLLLVYLFFSVANRIVAQRLSIERIQYATFDVNSPRTIHKDKVEISLYASISKTGLITVLNRDDYHNTLTFYTHQLTNKEIKLLNSIFNGNQSSKSYMIRSKLEKGDIYSGSYQFLLINYPNNHKDSLCFIDFFMSPEFMDVFKIMNDIFYDKTGKKRGPFTMPSNFQKTVSLSYKQSLYLPKIQFPSFQIK